MRLHLSLQLTRRVGTPESCSAVLFAPDRGVCGAGGREPAPFPRRPRLDAPPAPAPRCPGSRPLPAGLVPAWFLLPLPEAALCPQALTTLPTCCVPAASRAPWAQRAARRALVERGNG